MPSVLIIAPNFHYFAESIADAFEQAGYSVYCEKYDTPIHPYTRWNRLRYKIGNKAALREQSRLNYKAHILQVFHDRQPDLVFIVNGDILLPEVVQTMQQISRVAIWLFDSVRRMPTALSNLRFADKVFCYEQTDIDYLKSGHHIEALFLPQAADTALYHPLSVAKDLDIVFAGDLWQSKKRRQLIQAVVSHYNDRTIRVWGIYKPWYKGLWQWLTRERRDVYTNRNASAEQLNLDYNRAKVVLNIHHEQQKDGANPKVFEICASGAYQLCDANPYIATLFPDGEVGLYHNEQELFALIDYALTHDMSAQAQAAHEQVISHHTFTQRIDAVCEQTITD